MTIAEQEILMSELINEDDQVTIKEFLSLLAELKNIAKATQNEN